MTNKLKLFYSFICFCICIFLFLFRWIEVEEYIFELKEEVRESDDQLREGGAPGVQ